MSDKENKHDTFEIGLIGDVNEPDAVLVQIPLKHPNLSDAQMMDMCVGQCRRIEAYLVGAIKNRVMRKRQGGILMNGQPTIIQ